MEKRFKMDLIRYDFHEENKKHLLHFLKVANEQKTSRFCDLKEYKTLSKFFSLDNNLKKELKDYISSRASIIDITESDEEGNAENGSKEQVVSFEKEILETATENINQSTVDDITYSIKEHLETQKHLSGHILNSLSESKINPEEIFFLLSEELNFEEVLNFGISLQTVFVSDLVISYYIRYLLIKKLKSEYSDQLQGVLNEFSDRYSEILLQELTKVLASTESQSKIFLQFVDGLRVDFKVKLFRKLVFSCEKLHENHIAAVEILLSPQTEYNTLNRLIEILSNSTNSLSGDKSFGKLLVTIIKLLGKNVAHLEQPLKHIIGSHKTVWKSKVQKAFDDCLQDGLMFSQSFRC